MTARRLLVLAAVLLAASPGASSAQESVLPRSDSEVLLETGRWREAEDALYAAVRTRPRDPIARARLGRYLAMKGALMPGLVLIEEAGEFGLPSSTTRALATPIRALLEWRDRTAAGNDSAIAVRPPSTPDALLRVPVVRGPTGDTVWADLVPRMVGLDSITGASPRVGIETLEMLMPAFDVANHTLHLYGDPLASRGAGGRRYAVLRTARDVRVLVAPGRVRPLADALRELAPRWWQLDLPHGLLIVR